MKKYTLIIAISLLTNVLYSQANFINGYIITNNSDTVYGLINNKNYHKNALSCNFKKTENDSIITYKPFEITGYRFIDGKFYVSKEVDGFKRFVEYLIKGEIDIYFFQDEYGHNHYYGSKDSENLIKLGYEEKIEYVDGQKHVHEKKGYISSLNYLTSDYPELQAEIANIGVPNHKRFIRIAKKYHTKTCDGDECIVYEKKAPRSIKVTAMGGSSVLFERVTNDKTEIYPSYGISFLFQQLLNSEKVFLGIGLYYEGEIVSNTVVITNFTNGIYDPLFIKYYTPLIRIPISFNYIHPRNGFSPYFGFDFDILPFSSTAYKAGVIYKQNKVSFSLIADLKTKSLFLPYGSSLKLGLIYDLN